MKKQESVFRIFYKTMAMAVLLIAATSAYTQTTIYVRPTAAGSGDGSSWANARGGFAGIRHAIITQAADTVYVASGTYNYDNGGYIVSTKKIFLQGSINPANDNYNPVTATTLITATGTPTSVPVFIWLNTNAACTFKGLSVNFNIANYTVVSNINFPTTQPGQAFFCQGSGSSVNVKFKDMYFSALTGFVYGGAVYLAPSVPSSGHPPGFTGTSTSILFDNCVFYANQASPVTNVASYGGAICAAVDNGLPNSTSNLVIKNCGFNTNTASANNASIGGALYLKGGWNVTNSVFCGNNSITNSTFGPNALAGAIYFGSNAADASSAITGCIFSNNSARVNSGTAVYGGAIVYGANAPLTCVKDSFYSNRTLSTGAAPGIPPADYNGRSRFDIYVFSGPATITESLLQADISNTGIYNTTNYPNINSVASANSTSNNNTTVWGGSCPTSLSSFDLNISGSVFNDVDGMSNSLVDGAATNAGGTVFVSLVNPAANLVISSVAVDAQGKYSFDAPAGVAYNLILTNSLLGTGTSLTSSPFATATGSGGYVSTGEGTTPASDLNPNSIIVIPAGTTSFAAANFGIEQPPTAHPAAGSFTDPGGSLRITVPTLTGWDPEQGDFTGVSGLDTIIINTIPASGTLYYAGNPITTNGYRINNYDPTLLTYDPPTVGGVIIFTFREVDAAEKTSAAATVTMTVAAAPVVPDLTPIIRLVQNNFSATGVSRDLTVELQELRDRRTVDGTVEFSITVPVGFTIAFNSAITSITISGGATVAVQNGDWTLTDATQLGGRKLVFKANAATRILGLQKAVIGFTVTRTTSQADTSPVISVNITDDTTGDYDNNTLNNIFNRIINAL